jgi:hypothetical protein
MKKPVIALMYDFDKTLCTKDMQEYTFIPNVGMEPADVLGARSNQLVETHQDGPRYWRICTPCWIRRRSVHQSIRREDFVDSGKALELYRGVATWFDRVNKIGELTRVPGSSITSFLRGCGRSSKGPRSGTSLTISSHASSYYDENGVATWPKNVVNYTTKTQFLFRINKGILDLTDNQATE